MLELTEDRLIDVDASDPMPLSEYVFDNKNQLTRGFVYDRRYGVFRVDWAGHQSFMAMMYAWAHDCEDVFDLDDLLGEAPKLGVSCVYEHYADEYLKNTVGTCFRSSVSPRVTTWNTRSLSVMEKRIINKYCKITTIDYGDNDET